MNDSDLDALAELLHCKGDCDYHHRHRRSCRAYRLDIARMIVTAGWVSPGQLAEVRAQARRDALDDLLHRADDGIEFGPENFGRLFRMVNEVAAHDGRSER